jgi:hypothetical protein
MPPTLRHYLRKLIINSHKHFNDLQSRWDNVNTRLVSIVQGSTKSTKDAAASVAKECECATKVQGS